MRYTSEQLQRRTNSAWTTVQAIGAPIQLLIFLINVVLVASYLTSGANYELAHGVSVLKVVMLYFMTVTGMFWNTRCSGHTSWRSSFSGRTLST